MMNYLLSCKRINPRTAIQECQSIFQDENEDDIIVREMRTIAACYLWNNQNDPKISGFLLKDDDPELNQAQELAQKMIVMGEEAEGITFVCMSQALQAKINHVYLGRDKLDVYIFDSETSENCELFLILRPGHYDILYTKEQIQSDHYDIASKSFKMVDSNDQNKAVNGVPDLYVEKLLDHIHFLYQNLIHLSSKCNIDSNNLLPDFNQKISNF